MQNRVKRLLLVVVTLSKLFLIFYPKKSSLLGLVGVMPENLGDGPFGITDLPHLQ